jgi:hypothetical protein
MKLFVVDVVSDLMLETIFYYQSRYDSIVVTPNYEFWVTYNNIINNMILCDYKRTDDNVNSDFAKIAMPGVLEGYTIPGIDLPLWEVISIDRLRFWYRPSAVVLADLIEQMIWDEVLVSLDINNTSMLTCMTIAKERGARSTAIKTGQLRSREMMDLVKIMTFDEYIVSYEDDEEFLSSLTDAKITVFASRSVERLKVMENPSSIAILFDKRDEWQCRKFLNEHIQNITSVKSFGIIPVDDRSKELVPTSLPGMNKFVRPISFINQFDAAVSFRWSEAIDEIPIPLKIIDYKGLNRARDVTPPGIEVMEI